MTVMASAASNRPAAKGSLAPSATRRATRVARAVSRQSARARSRRRRLASTPTTSPRRPTSAARSRTTTPVPQPTSSTRSRALTGTNLRKRRRSRAWVGVRPRASRLLAISSTLLWPSASRHGSGCRSGVRARRPATAVFGDSRRLTRSGSGAGVEPRALLAAEVADPARIRSPDSARFHDVGLAHRVLDELVGQRGARAWRGEPDSRHQWEQQHDGHDQEQKDRKEPHTTQRSGLIDTARRNSLSWVVSSDDTVTPFLLPAKKMPVSAPRRRIS